MKTITYNITGDKLKDTFFSNVKPYLESTFDIRFQWSGNAELTFLETNYGGSAGLYYPSAQRIEIDHYSADNTGIILHEIVHHFGIHEHIDLVNPDPSRTIMGAGDLSWRQLYDVKQVGNIEFIKLLPKLGLNPEYGAPIWGTPYSDEIHGNNLNNTIRGGDDSDTIFGFGGDDVLYGGRGYVDTESGADQLYGGDGADILYGNAGADLLSGGNGNDTIYGGMGSDTLIGGSGADDFRGVDPWDVVVDFNAAEGDTISYVGVV